MCFELGQKFGNWWKGYFTLSWYLELKLWDGQGIVAAYFFFVIHNSVHINDILPF